MRGSSPWRTRGGSFNRLLGCSTIACAVLVGCNNFSVLSILNSPPPAAPSTLKLVPQTVNILTGATQRFTASGGSGGYTFSVEGGASNGTIDSGGLYTAPLAAGTYTILVTDSSGSWIESTAQVAVAIALSVSPTSTAVNAGGSVTFTASGGSGSKSWSFSGGTGSLVPAGSSATYTAPWHAETPTITVTDLSGTVHANLTVNAPPPLQIIPSSASINALGTVNFTATGGSGNPANYSYSLTSGGGTLVGATYTAPASATTATVQVTDSLTGQTSNATITVTVPVALAISPKTITLDAGGSVTFTAGGGTPPYTFAQTSGGGSFNSVTDKYTAPWSATTATVQVTDSASATDTATITVNPPPPLTITPSSVDVLAGNAVTFTPGGGSGSYSFSLVSGSGSLVGSTYTTVTAETADIRLTDTNTLATVDATVIVYLPLTLIPASATVQEGGTYPFSATGGIPPYTYSMVSGGGSIVPSTGVYTAPMAAETDTVQVADSILNISTSTVTVQPPSSWNIVSIDAASRSGQYASLALDSGGLPKIAYYESSAKELRLAAYNGSSWSWATVDTSGHVGQYASLALLPANGYPRISYYDASNRQLDYNAWNGSSWAPQVVDSAGDVGRYSSLALDSGGNPRIAYYDKTHQRLKYAAWNGSSWAIQVVDSSANVGLYSTLALDSGGNPRIAYYDSSSNHLKYAAWNGSSWVIQVADGGPNDVGRYASLALDSGGNPRISYYDNTLHRLKYASWSGSWTIQVVDSSADDGMYSSLALDSGGNPRISYYDATNRTLKYAAWSGSWTTQVVDSGNNVGQFSSLKLDPFSGNPRIAYYDQTAQDLKFAKQ